MTPVISTDMQKLVLRVTCAVVVVLGAALQMLIAGTFSWQAVATSLIAAVGGAFGGVTKLGPGHVDVATLPLELQLQETVRPPAGPG